jgi:UDP-glucose 4-epimerase
MATVIGIFENCYKKKKVLPIVKPGTQTRRFTHIHDTVNACYTAWKKNKNLFYSVSNRKSYSIIEVAKLFKSKYKFLPKRKGERYSSALTNIENNKKVNKIFGKINLKNYIKDFVKKN